MMDSAVVHGSKEVGGMGWDPYNSCRMIEFEELEETKE